MMTVTIKWNEKLLCGETVVLAATQDSQKKKKKPENQKTKNNRTKQLSNLTAKENQKQQQKQNVEGQVRCNSKEKSSPFQHLLSSTSTPSYLPKWNFRNNF